jgi:hypothetical protein
MSRIVPVMLIVVFAMPSCASLPAIYPGGCPAVPEHCVDCTAPFLHGTWELVHYIEAALPGNRKGFLTGVAVISPATRAIECAMMTLEGFVLFSARYDEELVVDRAVSPFDKREFAEGIMEDIRLIFLQPEGPVVRSGLLADGGPVCRYGDPDGGFTDIVFFSDGSWEIRRYGKDLRLERRVRASGPEAAGPAAPETLPASLELKAYGPLGYELSMNLVSGHPLPE